MRVKDIGQKKPSYFKYSKKLEIDPEDVCKEILEDLLGSMFPREEPGLRGVWLAELSLGPGWKSCLITPARGQWLQLTSGGRKGRRPLTLSTCQVSELRKPPRQPRDFCQVQIDASDSSVVLTDQEEEEDTITLSDDLAEPPKKKTKYEKMPASALSGRQEEILVGCYQEWPQLTGSVVTEIVKDTGLLAQVVTRWYGERTRNIIEQILCNDKSSGST